MYVINFSACLTSSYSVSDLYFTTCLVYFGKINLLLYSFAFIYFQAAQKCKKFTLRHRFA